MQYRLPRRNHMTFPAELRAAIPDLPTCEGRVLQLDSIDGAAVPARFGMGVRLRLLVRETGKLKGRFTVVMDLNAEAAHRLGEMLLQLAGRVEK